jgi:hypothetical protein
LDKQLPFSNIAPFAKRSNILQDSNLAESGPFSSNKEELRRSVWELVASRYKIIKNIVLCQDMGRRID